MNINIYDVAKKAGVSVVTVSRVINNVETVKPINREKVLKAMNELNYQPNAAARSLARGKSNVVGVLVPSLADSFITEIIASIDKELEKKGFVMALSIMANTNEKSELKSNFLFQHDKVDGVIVVTPQDEEGYVMSLKKTKLPFVIIDNQSYPFSAHSIIVDNYKGGYDVGKYLLSLGHKKIAHIGGPTNSYSAVSRREGFIKSIEEDNLSPFIIACGAFDISTGYEYMNEWIEKNNIPSAVFAGDDLIAFGVMNALAVHNIKVPEEVSVVGFDNHPFASKLKPHLTTVQQPSSDLGVKGVETLFKIINGEKKRNIVIKLEPELIIRESTQNISK